MDVIESSRAKFEHVQKHSLNISIALGVDECSRERLNTSAKVERKHETIQ